MVAKSKANEIRNLLGLGQRPIADIFSLLEDIGIILFKKPISNSSLSAVFMKDKQNYLVIINSNRTLGHQIFSAAHELYHYYYDKELLGGICSVNNSINRNKNEEMADLFASYFLMPDEGVIAIAEKRKNKQGKLDLYDVVFLQQYFKVSWNAMLIKLENLSYVDNKDDLLNIGITRLTQMLNYDESLVQKTCDTYVSKRYLELVLKSYEHDEISKAKLIEYLNDVNVDIADISPFDSLINGGVDYAD